MNDREQNHVLPPYGNTGALNTYQEGLRACVDWVQVTFHDVFNFEQIIELLGLKNEQFIRLKTGKYRYRSQVKFGGISIYFDGIEDNMGVHLEFTGQGCREYESYNIFDWSRLFALFHLFKHYFSRLDIALDDFYCYFKLSTIRRKIRDTAVRSLFRNSIEIRKTRLKDGKNLGETIYFGSAQSMIQIRMYDKYLERIAAGKEIKEDIDFWIRTEIQSRDDRAHALAQVIAVNELKLGEVVAGTLLRYIHFCDKTDDSNRSRWPISKWWLKYLGDVEKLKLTLVAPDPTIQKSKSWIDKQVDTTLAMLYEAYKGDLQMMHNIIYEGRKKLKDKHFDMLKRYWLERNGGDLSTVNNRLEELEKKVIVTRMMDFEEFVKYETKMKKSPSADDN